MVQIKWALLQTQAKSIVSREIRNVYEKNSTGQLTVITPAHANDYNSRSLYFIRCEVEGCNKIHDPSGFIKVCIQRLAKTESALHSTKTRLRIQKLPALDSSDPEVTRKRKKKNTDTAAVGKRKPKRVSSFQLY